MSALASVSTDPTNAPTALAPDDGQRVDAASVRPGFQSLLNFIAFLRTTLAAIWDGGTLLLGSGNPFEFTASSLVITAPTTINGPVEMTSSLGVDGALSVGGTFSTGGSTTLGNTNADPTTISGPATANEPISFANNGRSRTRSITGVDSGGGTISYDARFQDIFWPAGALSANQIADVGIGAGTDDFVNVAYYGPKTLTIKAEGTSIVSLGATGTHFARLVKVAATGWVIAGSGA